MADLDIMQELPSVRDREDISNHLLPPAEHLYWNNLESFSDKLNIQGFTTIESKFLLEYYHLRMQIWIAKITGIVTQVIVIAPQFFDLSYYSFVLPLLYMPEGDPAWDNLDFPFTVMEPNNLETMSDFCLSRAERPLTAIAIAKYKAEFSGESFTLVNWSLAANTRCVENHRPDLAKKLLRVAIGQLADKDKIVELRLKIAENFSKSGDIASAVKECEQIANDFSDSLLYGKVMSSYFAYLAKDSKVEKILQEIDSALEAPQCQTYLPQLMYLKWLALRKTSQPSLASQIGEHLIENYGDNPYIALVLLAHGTDALSDGRYDESRNLLMQLRKKFPQTSSARQALEILARLEKE